MKEADSFYNKYNFPKIDRSFGVYTKDDLLDFAEAFATEDRQQTKDMIELTLKEMYLAKIRASDKEAAIPRIKLIHQARGMKLFAKELGSKL